MKKTIYINILLALSVLSVNAQNVRMYAFGHSLIHHAAEFGGTPETNIMHWMNDISQEAGNTFATGGQYGFLTTHDDLPPVSSWGYDGITSVWDDSVEPFSDADINTILLTAANFIQYVNPTDPHPLDNTSTVIQSTETIFDWVNNQEPNVRFYIYGNWPEMNLLSDFPPTPPLQSEIDDFHNTTIGSFADWWTDYHDEMLSSRPLLNSRLIPVGVIISKILRDLIPNQIPFDSLYFDAAPHGRESIYFLAGMITYMAIYEQNIPTAYVPNTTVHSVIRNNLDAIRNFAWSELNNFNLPGGDSRVFYTNSTITWDGSTDSDWNTATNWDGDAVPSLADNVVLVSAANNPVIASNVEVNNLDIQLGASLNLISNSLSVNGDFTLEGSMSVASGASLVLLGNISGAGAATINRNTTFGITDGQYSVIGSPITAGSTSSLGSIVYSYDETIAYDGGGTQGANRFVAAPEAMQVGDAYFSANTGDISFVGIPNTGDIDVALVYNAAQDGADAGFNLVSNPYTAAISYTNLMAGNAGIDGTLYIWDDGGSDIGARSNSDYITATGMGTTGSGSGSGRAGDWDGYIRSTQGFFVKANTAGTLNFTASMMLTTNNTDLGFFRAESSSTLRFSLSSDELYNDILIGFKSDATPDFDRTLDAYKAKGNKNLQLYSRMNDAIMAIQALPELTERLTIGLGFDIAEAGTYTFEIQDPSQYNFDIYLRDNLLDKLVNLSELGYSFGSSAVSNSDRFSLIFTPNTILSINNKLSSDFVVFNNGSILNVRMNQELSNATVKIYNMSGSLVKRLDSVNFQGHDVQTTFNREGLFIITIQSADKMFVKKFIK